jgi:hypothetical protein
MKLYDVKNTELVLSAAEHNEERATGIAWYLNLEPKNPGSLPWLSA